MKTQIVNSIFMETVSPEELLQVIKCLKHSAVGYDELDAQHIKSSSSIILQPLSHICSLSFTHGVFPDGMKPKLSRCLNLGILWKLIISDQFSCITKNIGKTNVQPYVEIYWRIWYTQKIWYIQKTSLYIHGLSISCKSYCKWLTIWKIFYRCIFGLLQSIWYTRSWYIYFYTPGFNEVEGGVYWFHLVRLCLSGWVLYRQLELTKLTRPDLHHVVGLFILKDVRQSLEYPCALRVPRTSPHGFLSSLVIHSLWICCLRMMGISVK